MVGEVGLEPTRLLRPADFKSAAYTNSATRPYYFVLQSTTHSSTMPRIHFHYLEAPTGIEPVYEVLQTSA